MADNRELKDIVRDTVAGWLAFLSQPHVMLNLIVAILAVIIGSDVVFSSGSLVLGCLARGVAFVRVLCAIVVWPAALHVDTLAKTAALFAIITLGGLAATVSGA